MGAGKQISRCVLDELFGRNGRTNPAGDLQFYDSTDSRDDLRMTNLNLELTQEQFGLETIGTILLIKKTDFKWFHTSKCQMCQMAIALKVYFLSAHQTVLNPSRLTMSRTPVFLPLLC